MKDSAIILSGGMDSVTMLYDRQKEIELAITFDYGSNHAKKEIECAKWHCNKLNIEHIIIELPFIHKHFDSSLLKGGNAIPTGPYNNHNITSTVVHFRNGIMLSIAAGLAESKGLQNLLIANHFGDHAIYPDCTLKFIKSMSDAIANGTYRHIHINAPYTMLSKIDIAKIGGKLNIDYSKTYSCYKGGEKHCGECATCIERKEAFVKAGIKDTTEYFN
jgi:7-cyano-7-deazaguanine synthase